MKNWDLNSDDARYIGRDLGVSGLLMNGPGSGDQELVHIAEPKKVVNQRRNIPETRKSTHARQRAHLREASAKQQLGSWVVVNWSVYGLADAPRPWWERGETDMTSQGWKALTTETC